MTAAVLAALLLTTVTAVVAYPFAAFACWCIPPWIIKDWPESVRMGLVFVFFAWIILCMLAHRVYFEDNHIQQNDTKD